MYFWINTFQEGVSLHVVQTEAMARCRQALMAGGFTISANVKTNLEGAGGRPFDVQLRQVAVGERPV